MLVACDPIMTTGLTTRDAETLTAQMLEAISTAYYERSPLTRPTPAPPSEAKIFV